MSRFSDAAGASFGSAEGHDPAEAALIAGDVDALADADMLAVLLRAAQRGPAPSELASRAIVQFGSFAALLAAPDRDLFAMPGFGTHAVAAIRLVHEAALRLARAGLARRRLLDDPRRLHAYLAAVLARERIEQFRVLFLDGADALILDEAQARGTVNHTPVYPREVVRRALELEAHGIVLVHNHPTPPISITLDHAPNR